MVSYRILALAFEWLTLSVLVYSFATSVLFVGGIYFSICSSASLRWVISVTLIAAISLVWVRQVLRAKRWLPSFAETAFLLEQQSNLPLAGSGIARGDLRTSGWILDQVSGSPFFYAHLKRVTSHLHLFPLALVPSTPIFIRIFWGLGVYLCFIFFQGHLSWHLPSASLAWRPENFEALLPVEGATWTKQSGSLSGISGTLVRFETPAFGSKRKFLFIDEGAGWKAIECFQYCQMILKSKGRYAVGTWTERSSFYPIQVEIDEPPRALLMAEANGEFSPQVTLELTNISSLRLRALASDDLRITKASLILKNLDLATETIVKTWEPQSETWKQDEVISTRGWESGRMALVLKAFDRIQSIESAPINLIFMDEKALREKRLLSLRSVIDEWVHVLGDLLDLEIGQSSRVADLKKRLLSIHYEVDEEASLVNAYYKELTALSKKIAAWIDDGATPDRRKSLLHSVERQILYGLSLIFQEKTGDIDSTQKSLTSAQGDLNQILEKIKKGESSIDSPEFDAALKNLTDKLQELQKKIQDLPNGPEDNMINRQALEEQLEESESLEQKIQAIKDQMARGDSKGAMREMESLLNQLSILSKEMDRSLQQWKNNVDQGSVQSSKRFEQQLEKMIKKQEALLKETEELKAKSEGLKEDSMSRWQPENPRKTEELQKKLEEKAIKQKGLQEEFEKAQSAFEEELGDSEWKELFRSQENQQTEMGVSENMKLSEQALKERRLFDSTGNQKESIELMQKLKESQKEAQKQMQTLSQGSSGGREKKEKIETLATGSKMEKERRRRIMQSLQQKVDDRFQKSHERYFEDLLQR